MMKLRWTLLFTALTVFLTACPGPSITATLELTANPNQVPASGAAVALTATVTAGAANVASVDFAVKDAASVLGTDSDTADNVYNFTTATVNTATTFVATARDAGGAAIGSDEVEVTVSGPDTVVFTVTATPNPVPTGGAPVTLTTSFTSGQDRVRSVAFRIQGQTTNLGVDNDGANGFSFTTAGPVTEDTTFEATARGTGGTTLATDEVAVTIGTSVPVPDGATLADTAEAIRNVTATTGPAATIAVTADITCTTTPDPCIPLRPGQKLLGATADGQFVATRKITTTGSGATVVEMRNNTSVEGFEFDGAGLYTAINAPVTIVGPVTVKDVKVGAAINDPIRMSSSGVVTMTNVEFTSTRQVFIQNFTTANLTGLKITINRAATDTGAAMTIVSGAEPSTVVLDALDLTTNLGGVNKDGLLIQSGINFDDPDPDDIGAMTATVKNSKVIFGAGVALANSIAFNFNIPVAGTLAIQTAASTGNSTNSTSAVRATYDTVAPGIVDGRLTPEQPVQP